MAEAWLRGEPVKNPPAGMVAWQRWREDLPIELLETMPYAMSCVFRFLTSRFGKKFGDPIKSTHEAMLGIHQQRHEAFAAGMGWQG